MFNQSILQSSLVWHQKCPGAPETRWSRIWATSGGHKDGGQGQECSSGESWCSWISTIPSQHISGEIVELCEVIKMHGRMTGRASLFVRILRSLQCKRMIGTPLFTLRVFTGQTDGDVCGILFGDLFQLYTRISNKVIKLKDAQELG